MGTRALIHIKNDRSSDTLVTIYTQFDGYPTGVGNDIKKALGSKDLVNGISDADTQVNGMGCAAAMLIAAMKTGCGNVYIYPADSEDCWEDYTYTLWGEGSPDIGRNGKICIEVRSSGEGVLYDGPISDFDPAKVEAAEFA